MATDFPAQLQALQNSTNDLNALTDKANNVVRRVEIFLRESCRVGGWASAYVPIPEEDENPEDPRTIETYLRYERFKGEYRITVTHLIDGNAQETRPWAECSRDTKLKTLEALPELIDELHKKVSKQVALVQARIDLLDSMIPSVGEPQQRPSATKKKG
jgi:hypothetical protein